MIQQTTNRGLSGTENNSDEDEVQHYEAWEKDIFVPNLVSKHTNLLNMSGKKSGTKDKPKSVFNALRGYKIQTKLDRDLLLGVWKAKPLSGTNSNAMNTA